MAQTGPGLRRHDKQSDRPRPEINLIEMRLRRLAKDFENLAGTLETLVTRAG
jgi:hypothetical protein